ncbi:MAG: hypothetical protein DMG55_23095 [Acidobacteria bacterium]|nr:MAG: hypothetical protein DMG55_23095 [Acidobacteriota bacterium]
MPVDHVIARTERQAEISKKLLWHIPSRLLDFCWTLSCEHFDVTLLGQVRFGVAQYTLHDFVVGAQCLQVRSNTSRSRRGTG